MEPTTKPIYFFSSASVPADYSLPELSICDVAASFSEQKKSVDYFCFLVIRNLA